MPTVPRLDSPQVQQSAGPQGLGQLTTKAPAEAFGLGQAITPIVDVAQQMFNQAKEQADQVAVLDADKKMTALQTSLLYDPTAGALNQKGKSALGAVDKTNTDFQLGVSEIENSLSNESQKQAFRQRYQAAQGQINRQLNEHASTEMQRYDDSTTQAVIQLKRAKAIADPSNASNVQDSLIDQQTTLQKYGQRRGWSEEQTKNEIDQARSQTSSEVVKALISKGDDQAAEAFYKGNTTNFVGEDKIQIEKMVEESALLGKAQRGGDDIFQRNSGSMARAMAEVKQIADPKLRKATEAQMLHNFSQKKLSDDANEEAINKSAVSYIVNGGSPTDFLRRFAGRPGQQSALSTSQFEAIQNFGRSLGEKSDGRLAYDLEQMAADPNTRDAFAGRDLYKDFLDRKLSQSEFSHFSPMQAKARAKEDDPEYDNVGTRAQIVREALLKLKLDPSESNKNPDIDKVVSFNEQVRQAVDTESRDKKRKLTRDEVQGVVDSLALRKITVPGWLWGTKEVPYAFGDKESQSSADMASFPKADVQKAAAALKSNGIQQTNENIINTLRDMQKMKNASSRQRARKYSSAE